jgi:cleavage and polyadenylation specificity factor subunit 1
MLSGSLVVSGNQLLYVNQNYRYALSVNEFGNESPFPLGTSSSLYVCVFFFFADTHLCTQTEKLDVQIALDNAYCEFLSNNTLLVSLKGGELYLFYLITDGRVLQSIKLSKAGASVLASCVSSIHPFIHSSIHPCFLFYAMIVSLL